MKIYTKILLMTLPLALLSLITGAGVTYYLSSEAIKDIALNWLETRVSEAYSVVAENENFLRQYGITDIASGVKKAQYDAENMLRNIEVGDQGYVFIVDQDGRIISHPDSAVVGADIGNGQWFKRIKGRQTGQLTFAWQGRDYLAMYRFFKPWKWFIIVSDPYSEVYGPINKTRTYIFILALIGSIMVALIMVLLIRKLTKPLMLLVQGAQKVGRGELDTQIPVQTRDELGHLSEAFNAMAVQLQASHGDLQRRERYYRSITENAPGIIILLDSQAIIKYLSPSFQRILGYDSPDRIGTQLIDIIHKDEQHIFAGFWTKVIDSRDEVISVELRVQHTEGSWRTIEATGRNLLDDRAVYGVVLNCRDTTLRRQFEEAIKVSENTLQHLTARLLSAQELERRRLSSELHDEISQSLTVMKLQITRLEDALDKKQQSLKDECERATRTVDRILEGVRRICHDLTPSALEDLGLTAALLWQLENIVQRNNIVPVVDIDHIDELFTQDAQILIYRIFQEALGNIAKHASATNVSICARLSKNRVHFAIEDNGKGFDPNQVQARRFKDKGLGLATMSERARMLGACLDIDTQPGAGTRIHFTLPIQIKGDE